MEQVLIFLWRCLMIKVNGELMDAAGVNITGLLELINCPDNRVAVEVNEVIVPKNSYDSTVLNDGDSVEVVRFVGGG